MPGRTSVSDTPAVRYKDAEEEVKEMRRKNWCKSSEALAHSATDLNHSKSIIKNTTYIEIVREYQDTQ